MRKQTKIVAVLSAAALLALGCSAVAFAAGWDNSTGEWQYLDKDGEPISDAWRKSGDLWFYLGSIAIMAYIVWCVIRIVSRYNRLTTRKLPQFNRTGGDDSAKVS